MSTSSDDKSPDVPDPVMRRRLPVVPGMAHPVGGASRPNSADGSRIRRSTDIGNGDALLLLLEEEQGQDSFRRSDSSIKRRPRHRPNLENLVIDRERGASPNQFSSGTNSPVDPVLTRPRRSNSCVDGADVSRVLGNDRRASFRSPRSPFIVPEESTPSLPSETDESTATSDVESQRQRELRRQQRSKRRELNTEDVRLAFSGGASASETPLTRPDKIAERRQHWAERRAVSHIDPRSVRRLLAALSMPVKSEVNDVDKAIRDVEETGREIQRMRLDSTGSQRQDGARPPRRWRSELNKANVEEALRNNQDTTPVPPARRSRLRSTEEAPRDGVASLYTRLDATPETPTQKAMLHHSTGSWRSNSAGDDEPMSPTSPTFQKSGYDVPVSVRMGLAPRRRPQSTYDNIPEDGPTTGQYVRNSTSDVIDASKASPRDSRRHGVVYPDTVDIDKSSRSPLQRSATLPHNWNQSNTSYRWRQLQRPIKMDMLKAADGGIIAAPVHREDEQLQELDSNIEAFQSRTLHSDRELSRKKVFRQMALERRYMEDGWDVAKPVVETEAEAEHPAPLVVPATELAADNSCKSDDTDSVASARDEGFESEYVCNSQRTSMSSTLEGELPSIGANVDGDSSVSADVTNGDLMSTPTESRKRYGGSQADSDDPYFARSIDSLVNTKELTLTDTINVDEPADGYNDIDTDKTMTTSAPEEGDSTTDETWTTTEYTVVHKVSMPLEPEVLPPAPPHRTTSKAESAKATSTSRSALLRKQPNNGAVKTSRSSPATATITTPKSSVMSKVTKRNGTTKVTPTSTKPSVAAEVTARLSCPRPKRPSVLTRHPSTSSLTSDGSSAGSAVTSKPTRHARPTRPSSAVVSSPSRAAVRSPLTPDVTPLRTSPAFVRGAAGRATMPASMLHAQKRRAAEARMSKEEAPVPPRRSSSIRRSRQLNLGKSPPTHRPMSAASPADTESATSSGDERAPSAGRPRRSQVGGVGVTTHDQSKESKMSRFFNRLATGRPRREKDATTTPEKPMTSSPASEGLARKTGLRQRTSTVGPKDSTITHDNRNNKTRTDKSSITTSLIDKSPYRKSALNRSSCADHNGNLNVKNATFHSSKC